DDGNTVMLYHLDEAALATTAVSSASVAPIPAIAWNQPTATVAGAISNAILGQAGASGFGFGNFGNAATFSGSLLLGYDGNNNGTYDPDLSANTTGATAAADAIPGSFMTGGNGEFTLEANVKFSAALGTGNREIISWDSS